MGRLKMCNVRDTRTLFFFIFRLERGYIYFYINFLVFFAFLCCLQFFSIMMPKITTNVLDNVRQCPLLLNATLLADPAVVAQHKEVRSLILFNKR